MVPVPCASPPSSWCATAWPRPSWISDPTWANHVSVFQAAGLTVKWYKYYDAATKGSTLRPCRRRSPRPRPAISRCCTAAATIRPAQTPPAISGAPWPSRAPPPAGCRCLTSPIRALPGVSRKMPKACASSPSADDELLVASSLSKNFGLYNERVGAFTLVCATKGVADVAFTQVKTVIRANYSNPPSHGAASRHRRGERSGPLCRVGGRSGRHAECAFARCASCWWRNWRNAA